MVKEIRCIHAGFEECDFLIRSENETELVEFVQRHAQQTHDVSVSRDHVQKIMREA